MTDFSGEQLRRVCEQLGMNPRRHRARTPVPALAHTHSHTPLTRTITRAQLDRVQPGHRTIVRPSRSTHAPIIHARKTRSLGRLALT